MNAKLPNPRDFFLASPLLSQALMTTSTDFSIWKIVLGAFLRVSLLAVNPDPITKVSQVWLKSFFSEKFDTVIVKQFSPVHDFASWTFFTMLMNNESTRNARRHNFADKVEKFSIFFVFRNRGSTDFPKEKGKKVLEAKK